MCFDHLQCAPTCVSPDCPAETRAYLHGSIQKSSGPCRVRMDPCLLYANAQVRVCFARSLGVWLVRGLDCITVAEEAIGKSPGALHEFASDLLAFLFMLLSDESREVAARAVSELNVPPVRGLLPCSPLRYFLGSRHTLATSHLQKYIKVVRCGTSPAVCSLCSAP